MCMEGESLAVNICIYLDLTGGWGLNISHINIICSAPPAPAISLDICSSFVKSEFAHILTHTGCPKKLSI